MFDPSVILRRHLFLHTYFFAAFWYNSINIYFCGTHSHFLMSITIATLSESLMAEATGVRAIALMRSDVIEHVTKLGKRAITSHAFENLVIPTSLWVNRLWLNEAFNLHYFLAFDCYGLLLFFGSFIRFLLLFCCLRLLYDLWNSFSFWRVRIDSANSASELFTFVNFFNFIL